MLLNGTDMMKALDFQAEYNRELLELCERQAFLMKKMAEANQHFFNALQKELSKEVANQDK